MSNPIVVENARTDGRLPFDQALITGHGDITVAAFARAISVNVGERVEFSADGGATTIDIYRVGWYGGDYLRLVGSVTNTPTAQPEAVEVPGGLGGTSCSGWSVTAVWEVPEDHVSGFHLALVRSVGATAPNAFWVPFVVHDDARSAAVLYKTSDATWAAAYNHYGTKSAINGQNIYGRGTGVGNILDRCVVGSYHRPNITRSSVSQTYWVACELPMIAFLERNGFDVKYATCVDLDRQGVSLLAGKVGLFLSNGHDEYWSTPMYDAIVEWRDVHGGHSVFTAGNEVFWRIRYEYVGDEVLLWCYKDTMPGPNGTGHVAGEPFDPVSWTGTWADTRWPDRRPGGLLTGTEFTDGGMNGVYDYDAVVPKNPYGGLKVWGGSALVDSDLTLTRVIGFEADRMYPTQPGTSARVLAAYTRAAPGGLSDANGQNYNLPGNIEWGIVAQRYASGALTVGFGTCQWSWLLDRTHDRGTGQEVSRDAQQFTVNLLRDLGATPASPMPGVAVRPRNALSAYADLPPAAPTPPGGRGRLYDGRTVYPYMMRGGVLVGLEVHGG